MLGSHSYRRALRLPRPPATRLCPCTPRLQDLTTRCSCSPRSGRPQTQRSLPAPAATGSPCLPPSSAPSALRPRPGPRPRACREDVSSFPPPCSGLLQEASSGGLGQLTAGSPRIAESAALQVPSDTARNAASASWVRNEGRRRGHPPKPELLGRGSVPGVGTVPFPASARCALSSLPAGPRDCAHVFRPLGAAVRSLLRTAGG